MAGALKRIAGPAYLAAAAADIYTPPASTIFTVIRHIRVVNKTAGAVTFTLYVGATGGSAGGTEIAEAKSIAAHDYLDIFFSPGLKMIRTDFLSGLASAAKSLVITVLGTQEVA